MFKSGFVTLMGRPNVGKSTFLNYVLGQKVSIVSPKAQTTRNKIRGIYTTKDSQIVFIDTPGIHKAKNELGNVMNSYSKSTLNDSDAILWIVDGSQDFGSGDEYIINMLKNVKNNIYLVVNKLDLIKDKKRLSNNIDKFIADFTFKDIFYISSINGDNINKLLTSISNNLEEGPMYYPEDQISDNPESFIISEIIREKILLLTKEEVPHSIAVVVEQMKRDDKNLLNIFATIFVERSSQKKIIIGSGGKMIKEIGTLARKDIVMLIGEKIYLELFVKIEEDWREKKNVLRRMGYFKEN